MNEDLKNESDDEMQAVVGNRDKVFITESPVKVWQKLGNFNEKTLAAPKMSESPLKPSKREEWSL